MVNIQEDVIKVCVMSSPASYCSEPTGGASVVVVDDGEDDDPSVDGREVGRENFRRRFDGRIRWIHVRHENDFAGPKCLGAEVLQRCSESGSSGVAFGVSVAIASAGFRKRPEMVEKGK